MEATDEDSVPAAYNDDYYFNLLVDLENITAPKLPTMFVLPEESIWNTLKLTSLAKKTAAASRKGKVSKFEREIQRINASAATSIPIASKGSSAAHIVTNCAPLTNREKYVHLYYLG